jgi:DNA-binding transcriptional MerR regulator
MDKADGAFLTIGELAKELGVAQHILRYWETRFPQLRPLQRSGNRRYYRLADVETARRINQLLNEQGFTVRGAQRVLEGKGEGEDDLEAGAVEAGGRETAMPVTAEPPRGGAPKAGLESPKSQSELALGDVPEPRPARGPFDSSDVALLIARLTVIRQNLSDALES